MGPFIVIFNTENGFYTALPKSFVENWVILVIEEMGSLCKLHSSQQNPGLVIRKILNQVVSNHCVCGMESINLEEQTYNRLIEL